MFTTNHVGDTLPDVMSVVLKLDRMVDHGWIYTDGQKYKPVN